MSKPSIALLATLFVVDGSCASGIRNKVTRSSNAIAGEPSGYKTEDGYYRVRVGKHQIPTHRIVYMLRTNTPIPSDMQIDHIDGNKSNNTVENLRIVSSTTNSQNRAISSANSSGIVGVSKRVSAANVIAYTANWTESGKRKQRVFSVSKYGHDEALHLAIMCRAEQIERLNLSGSAYTNRHGI